MTKTLATVLVLAFSAALSGLTGCQADAVTIRIAALKGPTAMGLINLIEKGSDSSGQITYRTTLHGAPDEIVARISNREVDIAALPTNTAAVLYNKTRDVQYLATNTLGVQYLLTNGVTVNAWADLIGTTIRMSGQGTTAEYVVRQLLTRNGLDPDRDVHLAFYPQHADVTTLLVAGQISIAVLPQPFVATATMTSTDVQVGLDLNAEWTKTFGPDIKLPMGCLVVRTEFARAHPETVARFLTDYQASVTAVHADPVAAAVLMEKHQITATAAIARKAIELSTIVYVSAQDSTTFLNQFLTIMYTYDPKSVGGSLPDEGFYYLG